MSTEPNKAGGRGQCPRCGEWHNNVGYHQAHCTRASIMNPTQPPLGATPEPSATPRTNWELKCAGMVNTRFITFARTLETELATARAALSQCEERVKASKNGATGDAIRSALVKATGSLGLLIQQSGTKAVGHIENYQNAKRTLDDSWPSEYDHFGDDTPALSRAESAESALSFLTAKLAQCEEKLAKQERDILWVETRISCDDSGAEVLRQREQIERITAAHAKALEDGRRMREALEHYRDTVSAGGSTYARDALAASASATTGNGGEIS